MKHTTFTSLTAISAIAMLTFSNCKKEQTFEPGFATESEIPGSIALRATDRIDAIVKGMALDSYSFSFAKPIPTGGITKTSYGADNYLVYADPQDVICPEPFRIRQKKIAIWKRPNFIQPTCPDMTIDIWKAGQIQDLIVKADAAQFKGLKVIGLSNGGGLLATDKFTSQYQTLRLDRIDAITKDLNPEKYLLLNAPGDFTGGFTRSFYGYADLNSLVFQPLKTNLKDLLKPTLKGCFDPIVLSTIKARLEKIDPAIYNGLNVTTLPQDKNIGVLSMY